MKAHIASLINAITLIGLGTWGYFDFTGTEPSPTALIPVGVGFVLLILSPGVKKENKVVAHIAVLLTLLILFGLGKPLLGAISKENTMGIIRISIMMLTTLLAMIAFVKSFIAARKAREAGN